MFIADSKFNEFYLVPVTYKQAKKEKTNNEPNYKGRSVLLIRPELS